MSTELLKAHLREHLVAASTGCALFRRVSRTLQSGEARRRVARLAVEIEEDRDALRDVLGELQTRPSKVAAMFGRLGAGLARLKPSGRGLDRSGQSDVRDIEALRAAVAGKAALWDVLIILSEHDDRLDRVRFETLLGRAERQSEALQEIHRHAVVEHLVS